MKKIFWKLSSLAIVASMLLLSACTTAPAAAPTTPPPTVQPTVPPATAVPANPQPTAQPTVPPTAAATKAPVYLTLNVEQQSTWVRNFNPFSPDARVQASTIIYEPMMIFNKATA